MTKYELTANVPKGGVRHIHPTLGDIDVHAGMSDEHADALIDVGLTQYFQKKSVSDHGNEPKKRNPSGNTTAKRTGPSAGADRTGGPANNIGSADTGSSSTAGADAPGAGSGPDSETGGGQ